MPIRTALVAFIALVALACSINAPLAEAPSQTPADVAVSRPAFAVPTDAGVAKAGCAPNMFVAGDRCFDSAQAACVALGCDSCVDLETAPAQVRCWD